MRRTTVVYMLYAIWIVSTSEALMAQQANTVNINSENECLIPFHMIHRLMAFEVIVNGISGYLYLDTAIDGLVLSNKYFKSGISKGALMNSNGRALKAGSTDAHVQVGCLSMDFFDARVMSLDHIVINEPVRILGLVGCALFKGFELRIDYRNKTLQLLELDKSGKPLGNAMLTSTEIAVPFFFKGPWPVIQVLVGTQTMFVILDTGASVNVLHARFYKRLSSYFRLVQQIKLRTWGSEASEVPLTRVAQVMIDDVPMDTMNTVWYDVSILNAEFSGPAVTGVFGQELMKQYILSFNFSTRIVSFYHYKP